MERAIQANITVVDRGAVGQEGDCRQSYIHKCSMCDNWMKIPFTEYTSMARYKHVN